MKLFDKVELKERGEKAAEDLVVEEFEDEDGDE